MVFDVGCASIGWRRGQGGANTVMQYLDIESKNLNTAWGARKSPDRCENDPGKRVNKSNSHLSIKTFA